MPSEAPRLARHSGLPCWEGVAAADNEGTAMMTHSDGWYSRSVPTMSLTGDGASGAAAENDNCLDLGG